MDELRIELEGRIAEVLAATALALVAGLLLWPPGNAYWTGVSDAVGEGIALAVVGGLAVGLGAWIRRTAAFPLVNLALGGLLAYAAGMAAIEVLLTPDSPVHLLWYGTLLACFVGGGALWAGVDRLRRSRRST